MREYRLSPGRRQFNAVVVGSLDRVQVALARHWLAVCNWALAFILGLALLAPLLMELGYAQIARPIYWVFQAICHQWPFRSFFLFGPQAVYGQDQIVAIAGPDEMWTLIGTPALGFKMAFCERDLAIVLAGLAMGLFYARVRRRLAPPTLILYVGLLLPIIVDGFTQLPGWRESIWEYRVSTGALAGAATVWLLFPYLELRADRWLAASGLWTEPSSGGGDAPG